MKLDTLGEKKFLQELLPKLRTHSDFINGFGHDASVLDIGLPDVALVMKIDRAAKPIAAVNGWADYRMWGRLAVTANCSDVLVAGGDPKGFMIGISVPGSWESQTVEDIILGAQEECEANRIAFLGGDTKESNESHVVGSAVGSINPKHCLYRRRGRVGDVLVVAGELGGFLGSYLLYKDEAFIDKKNQCLAYMACPKARWAEASFVNANRFATSGIDLSDGLYDALQNITEEGCGVVIKLDSLPCHDLAVVASSAYDIPRLNISFGVGDWAILYAMERDSYERLLQLKSNDLCLKKIGEVTGSPGTYALDSAGTRYKVRGLVNEHFVSKLEDQGDYFDRIQNQIRLEQ